MGDKQNTACGSLLFNEQLVFNSGGQFPWPLVAFFPERVASLLAIDPSIVEHLTGYLYFRGWYMLIFLGFILTYVRGWYVCIVFSALTLLGVVSLMFDLFSLYPYRLQHPTEQFTVLMAIRLLGLACVLLNARNAGRLPE